MRWRRLSRCLRSDMYEHSLSPRLWRRRTARYVEAFMETSTGAGVQPLSVAVHGASEPFGAAQDEVRVRLLLRYAPREISRRRNLSARARWFDPPLSTMAGDLPATRS